MINIKDISGNIRFSTPINEGSKRKFLLMKEDYITLKFSLEKPIYFKLGDYVDIPNDFTSLFEVCDIQKPTFNNSTGGYDYELRLDAYYWKWKNKKFKFTPEVGGQEASWSLTASLDVQLGVFLKNLQALGYTYRGKNFEFSIDSTVENKALAMSYDNINLLDALSAMAQTWECEYWITNSVIHFGRCEYGTPVDFELGKNVLEMTRSDSQTNFATRIFAFGSTRNIPTNYRPVDESIVVNGITQKRLMLPVGTPYIDAYSNMSTEEAVEDIVVFDDVYPRRIGNVSDITTHEYKEIIKEEGKPDVVKKWNAYRFKDTGIIFSKDYVLEGQELKIIFQSGTLNGMEFTVSFNPCDKEGGEVPIPEKNADGSWNPAAQVWEIVRNEDYGRPLPDDILRPQGEHMEGNVLVPADTYILSGFDTKFVSDAMIPTAEQELKEKALKYVEKSKIDPSTYDNKMMFDCMVDDKGNPKMFEIGDRVNLINSAYFETGSRQSRIIGFEYNLDIPYDSPVYTVGETASYSRIGEIENKIDSLTYKGQTYTGTGGNGVYVIGTNDSTPASNRNVFSALNSLKLFLSSAVDDEAAGIITFLKGLLIGKNGSGFTSLQDGTSQLVVDRLYVKIKAIFDELEVKKKTYVGGEQILSPAGMKCIRVEERTDAYRCYFKAEEDGIEIENEFTPGTLAIAQECNIKVGVSHHVGNRYYWRLVTAVGSDYIDLSKTECDPNIENDIPVAGDDIVALGHETDITRQGAIVLSSVNEVAPSILMYQGINDFTLTGKEVTSFDFDKVSGKARMRVYGDTYIGDKEGKSYMKYDPESGLEIKGQLAVGSKLGDGRTIESAFQSTEDGIVAAQDKAEEASAAASDASSSALTATRTANSAAGVATNAKNRLDGWAADGVISPLEKQGIKDEIVRIDADKTDVSNGYSKYTLGAADAYNRAHTAYRAALVTLSSTEVENIPIPADFAVKQTAYYTERTTALAVISTAAKKVADDAAKAAEEAKKSAGDALTAIGGYDYLKQALKGGTAFQGGLGLTSTMLLGQTLGNSFIVKSGVNGIYDATKPGGGISSWAGGPMKDLAEDYPLPWASTPQPANPELYANSVTRMDGTGYDVGGNFWKSGDGKIHCDPLSFFVGEEKVGDILSLFTPVRRNNALVGALQNIPFEDGTGKGLVKFGKHTLREDSDGNVLFEKSDGTPVNLLVTGGVTMHALGSRSAATIMDGVLVDGTTIVKQDGKLVVVGGGGGSVDMTTVWSALAANTSEQINASHIPSLDWSKIGSGKPTTLAGYGITDAVTLNTTQDITANKKWTDGVNSIMIATSGSMFIDVTTTGGWARALEFYGNSTLAGMFGAYGGGSSLNYMYVGAKYDSPWQTWNATESTVNVPYFNASNFSANINGVHAQKALYLPNSAITIGATTRPRFGRFDRADGATVLQLGTANTFEIIDSGWNKVVFSLSGTEEPVFRVNKNALNVDSTVADIGVRIRQSGVSKSYFGWNTTYGTYMYSYPSAGKIHITDSGIPAYNGYPLLHSNNYNSYAPSLTGAGASGTWNIGINGEAYKAKYISNTGSSTSGTTTGWFRIGSTSNSDSAGNVFTLYLRRNYSYANNENYIFQICVLYQGHTTITQVAGYANTRLIDQIRVTGAQNSGSHYIDIHVSTSTTNNSYYWTIVGDATAQSVWTVNPSAGAVTATFYTAQGFSTSNILKGNYLAFRNYNNYDDAGYVGRGSNGSNQIYLASYNNNNVIIDAGSGVVAIPTSKFGIGVIPTSSYKLQVAGDIHATNWIRTSGSNGWYSETYGGGIHMTDANYVKVFNNKSFQVTSNTFYAVHISGGSIYSNGKGGSSWLNGYGIVNAIIPNNGNQTPLWVCARNDSSLTNAGADRIFAMELYNTGTMLRFAFGNAERFDFNSNGLFNAVGGITTGGDVNAGRNVNVAGRILVGSPSTGSEKVQVAGWYGTTGAYGWYNSTYQGGIYMNETGWLKVYNGVKWYLDGVSAWGIGGHYITMKMYNASHVGFNMATNAYTWGIYSNSDGNLYFGRRNGNVNDSSGIYYYTFGAGLLTITGNLLLTGGATMRGSDITKKNVINRILLPLDKIAAAPLIRYRWKDNRNNETHIGGSAQYTNSILPECSYKVGDTWSMDYETTAYAFAVSTAKHFLDYINEQATKEDARDIEIRDLKRRIEILERRH